MTNKGPFFGPIYFYFKIWYKFKSGGRCGLPVDGSFLFDLFFEMIAESAKKQSLLLIFF